MRIATGILASAAVLFTFGAFGLIGTWGLATGTVLGFVGAIWAVTVMEEREHAADLSPLAAAHAAVAVNDSATAPSSPAPAA
jgi:hypothetical protein